MLNSALPGLYPFIAGASLLTCMLRLGTDTNHVWQPWCTWDVCSGTVCVRLMPVAIFEWISIHINCIACTSWDDITLDMYEANLSKKGKLRQRKQEKAAAARSCSMSSKDSVFIFPDSTKEEGLDSRECQSSFSTHKSIGKVARPSPAPWDTDVDWPLRKCLRRTPHGGPIRTMPGDGQTRTLW